VRLQVEDGPNDEGEMYTRPGRLADALPMPYANEQVGLRVALNVRAHLGVSVNPNTRAH